MSWCAALPITLPSIFQVPAGWSTRSSCQGSGACAAVSAGNRNTTAGPIIGAIKHAIFIVPSFRIVKLAKLDIQFVGQRDWNLASAADHVNDCHVDLYIPAGVSIG
jgi:hypothetical protein